MLLSLKKKFFPKGFPSWSKWKRGFRLFTKKEKITLIVFLVLFLSSAIFLALNFYFKNTEIEPVQGGTYKEGVVGRPRFINPIYGGLNDIDRDLIQFIFSGLMKYDGAGNIVPDLANECNVLEEGKAFECYLKENVVWQDGEKLNVDDIIFTIETIQNSDYKSPLRAVWLGVEIERISDLSIRFKLRSPYSAFLENLTLKIIPSHVWKDIPAENFPLSIYNLQPIGSGPYQLKTLNQDKSGNLKSLTLAYNPRYFGKKPNIPEIYFYFFDKEEDLIKAAQRKEIQGLSLISFKSLQSFIERGFKEYRLSLPRYFAVFFNPDKSKTLSEEKIRQALNYGTDKKAIVEKVFLGEAEIVNSPILPELYNFALPLDIYEFDLEKARELIEEAGFVENESGAREKVVKEETIFQFKKELKAGSQGPDVKELQRCLSKYPEIYPADKITGFFDQDTKAAVIKFQEKFSEEILKPWGITEGTGVVSKSTRAKLNELCGKTPKETLRLSFSIATVDQPVLIEVANLLKEQWKALGAEVEIQTFDIQTLEKEIIKPRNYEALLFGEVLGALPDPLPFWHSSQKKDPGLNLALYEDKKADKFLEEARKSLNLEVRAKNLEEFQNTLLIFAPAVFLYNPEYIYLVSDKIGGLNVKMIVDPSKRFVGVENWYARTNRVWKKK